MGDIFDQVAAAPRQGDIFDQVSGQTPLQQSMRQHFQASENYDTYLHSQAPKAVPRPPMKDQGFWQEYQNASNAAHAEGRTMPQDVILGPLRQAATLTKGGYQVMAGGKMPTAENPQGKAGILGTPPPEDQFLNAAKGIGTMMLLGAVGGEGTPPTTRLNEAINGATVSDPAFSGARSILGKMALRSGARMMGVPGSSVDVINALIKRVGGAPAAGAPTASLPPEVPEIVRQGWAMQRGGIPAPAAETGEALGSLNVPRGTIEAPQGGHAGGDVISAEEAARSGNNYIVDKNGRLTYHGKSFAPEETPSGGTHVTVMPDGTYRINAGTDLNAAQKSGLKNAIPNINEGLQSVPLKVPAPKAATDPFSGPRNPVMEPSQSTTIAQHGYHPNSQTMVVQFKNGNVYEYRGVPKEVFDAYRNSESQGSYFANNIKGRYTTNLRGNVGASPGFRVRQSLGGKP